DVRARRVVRGGARELRAGEGEDARERQGNASAGIGSHRRSGYTSLQDRMSSPPARPGRYALFQNRDFRFHQVARFLSIFGLQMLAVAVGWQIYELTKDPLALGLAGL